MNVAAVHWLKAVGEHVRQDVRVRGVVEDRWWQSAYGSSDTLDTVPVEGTDLTIATLESLVRFGLQEPHQISLGEPCPMHVEQMQVYQQGRQICPAVLVELNSVLFELVSKCVCQGTDKP